MRHASLALSLSAVLAVAFSACGEPTSVLPMVDGGLLPTDGGSGSDPASCTGRCDCVGTTVTCACMLGSTCTEVCNADNCRVSCNTGSTCTVEGKKGMNLSCSNDSICSANAGDDTKIQCSNTAKCNATVAKKANLQCSNSATCTFTAGDQTNMQCSNTATCTLECATGAVCTFQCSDTAKCTCKGAGCNLVCGVTQPTNCPDGRKVCGQGC